MAYLDMSFDWPVCDAGYRLAPPRTAPRPKGRSKGRRASLSRPIYPPAEDTLMHQAGRRIEASPRIFAKSKAERLHRPLEFHKTLYVDFAGLDGSPEACLEFARRFGLLGLERKGGGEALVLWQDAIAGMSRAIKLSQTDRRALEGYRITPLHGALTPSPPDGRLIFRFRPNSLLHGMQLQFVQAISRGLAIKECGHCGKLFEAGGKERRRDARFCSKECKINFHNLEKRRVK